MVKIKGTPKTGGRTKGTPNRVTADLKKWICDIIDGSSEQFMIDIVQMDSAERVRTILSLINYIIPKQGSFNSETFLERERQMLQDMLFDAPDDFVFRVAERLNELQSQKDS